jgi:hypothetical protein
MDFRDVEALTEVNDAWQLLADLVDASPVGARVVARDEARSRECLVRLQVTTRSALGGLAYNCGGIVIDHGWLRILGGGHEGLRSLSEANHMPVPTAASTSPGFLVVAEDVLGGRFAVDGGERGVEPGTVCYFGPDSLSWVDLGVGHGQFVERMLCGATTEFYDDLRWPGWEREVAVVGLDKGLSLWPPPFSAEGQDVGAVSRAVVPHAELVHFYEDMARQL